MALKQTKLCKEAVGGVSSIYKSQDQFLGLQAQKNDAKDLKEFVVEILARYDVIMNQKLEKFQQEIKDMVQQKYDYLMQYTLKALTGLSKIIIKEEEKKEEINLAAELKIKEADCKIGNLENKMQRIEDEMIKMQELSVEAESKLKEVRHKTCNVDTTTQKIQDGLTMIQFRSMEFAIRIRGIKEIARENLRKISSDVFAEMLQVSSEEVMCKIDRAYRVNSWVAKQRQLPRDVVIYFTDKSVRNDIVRKSFNYTPEVNGTRVWIFKELPSKMLTDRRSFGFLVNELKKYNIPYRWDAPVGIILRYQGERYQLNTVEKAEEFYHKIFKMGLKSSRKLLASGIQCDKEKQNDQVIEAQCKQMEMEGTEKQQVTEGFLDVPPLEVLDMVSTSYQAKDHCIAQLDYIQVAEKQKWQRPQPLQAKKRRKRFYKSEKI